MSVKHTINRLHNAQHFVEAIYRATKAYNRHFEDDVQMVDRAGRLVAAIWRDILHSSYEFADGDFAVLLEEMFGDLLYVMVDPPEVLFENGRHPQSAARCAIFCITAMLCKVLNIHFVPDREVLNAFASAVSNDQALAHRFAYEIQLPPF